MRLLLLPLLIAVSFQPSSYRAEIDAFRQHRAEEIGSPTGWAALVGLHWLSHGEFIVGSDAISGIRLTGPSAPGRLGTLTINGDDVHFRVSTGLDAFVKGKQVYDWDMTPGVAPEDGLKVGGLTVVLIRRRPKMALGEWDLTAPTREALTRLTR